MAALVTGCGGASTDATSSAGGGAPPRKIVVAFYPLGWLAEQLTGGDAEIVNLTPPGAEPHDLELTARDIAQLRSADSVLYLGDDFQPALEAAVDASPANAIDVLQIEGLDLQPATSGDGESQTDPHIWLDPARFAIVARGVAEELSLDSSSVEQELRQLDARFRAGLRSCRRTEVFTSHAAFGYLTDRYGLQQVAITGLSPEAEPLPRDLERVSREAEKAGATTIFFETLVSPKLSQTVARDAGARTAVLDPLEGIAEERQAAGEDYLSVMQQNLKALQAGLDCREGRR